MRYEFKVNPKSMQLIVEDIDDKRLEEYKKEYKEFIFRYQEETTSTAIGLLKVLEGDSDEGQMLILGVDEKGNEVPLVYYYVGQQTDEYSSDEDIREYENAMKVLNDIIKHYKI